MHSLRVLMVAAVAGVIAFLGLASFTAAQDRSQGGFSDTFVFDKNSQITSWDGSDPSAPPYPGDMGAVSLRTSFGGSYGSAIDAPFQLGYLNNGFLAPCDPLTLGPKVWTIGDGTNIGDTFTQYGATTCPYFTGEWGTYNNSNNRLDGFSVDATYTIVQGPRTCPRFKPCYYPHITVLTGGTGMITDMIIN